MIARANRRQGRRSEKVNPLVAQRAGAIVAPSNANVKADALPKATLRLEQVVGYRSRACSNNVFWIGNGKIAYHAASLGITLDVANHVQQFFCGHCDDVTALAYDKQQRRAATGQVGKVPYVCVWRIDEDLPPNQRYERTHKFDIGSNMSGVSALGFTADGHYLVVIASNNDNDVFLFDLNQPDGEPIANARASLQGVYDIAMHPSKCEFVTAGGRGAKFWTFDPEEKSLGAKTAVFGDVKAKMSTTAVTYLNDGRVLSGSASGDLRVWKGNQVDHKVEGIHTGSIYSIATYPDDSGFVTAGRDGTLKRWNSDFESIGDPIEMPRNDAIRAVDIQQDGDSMTAILGTALSNLYQVDLSSGNVEVVMDAHDSVQDHETWGLATPDDAEEVFTCGADGTVRRYKAGKLVPEETYYSDTNDPSDYKTMDTKDNLLAVGTNEGILHIFDSTTLKPVQKLDCTSKDNNRGISSVKFSPDGKTLAVGTFEMMIHLYTTETWELERSCQGHTSFVISLDWCKDSSVLRSNSGDYELLFWNRESGEQVTKKEETKDLEWATTQCTICWETLGMWQVGMDGTDINACDSHGDLLINANDLGEIQLLTFPASLLPGDQQRKARVYGNAHSAHVMNVRFSASGEKVFSVGGLDGCMMQWDVVRVDSEE